MMPQFTKKDFYKAICQFLFNELGITKTYIDDLVEKKVNERIEHLAHSNLSEDAIDRIVRKAVGDRITSEVDRMIVTSVREEIVKSISVQFEGSVSFDGKRMGVQTSNINVVKKK